MVIHASRHLRLRSTTPGSHKPAATMTPPYPEVEVFIERLNSSLLGRESPASANRPMGVFHNPKGPSYNAPPSQHATVSYLCNNVSSSGGGGGGGNDIGRIMMENLTADCHGISANASSSVTRYPMLGALLSLFALITVLGNVLVIVAVARERYLRSVTNYFIVSLAIADFIIGSVVMPFSISLEVTNQLWLFGTDWCDVWHSFDVLASTASILNLSVISLDRYWAITDPIAYPRKMSTGRAMVLIALVWICSAAISFPAILWWRAVATEQMPEHICFFTEDSGYLIFSSIVSFYVPISVILYAYYRIYKAASEQIQSLKTGTKVMHKNGMNGEAMTLRMHRGGGGRLASDAANVQYSRTSLNSDSDNESPAHLLRHHLTLSSCDATDDIRPSRMISRKWRNFAISRKLSKLAKEQKAAKTLGIVMGVFCICWVPFFVSNVLYGICKNDCVYKAEIIFPIFTWLGYINSGMNPIIYALSMRDFRRAFARILCCCCPNYFRVSRRHTNMCETSFSTSSFYVSSGCNDRYSNVRL